MSWILYIVILTGDTKTQQIMEFKTLDGCAIAGNDISFKMKRDYIHIEYFCLEKK